MATNSNDELFQLRQSLATPAALADRYILARQNVAKYGHHGAWDGIQAREGTPLAYWRREMDNAPLEASRWNVWEEFWAMVDAR